MAIGLIESIVHTGDGRGFDSAWTVFRVKEEYEVLKAGGYLVEGQSLAAHGGRHFDILDARKAEGGAEVPRSLRHHGDVRRGGPRVRRPLTVTSLDDGDAHVAVAPQHRDADVVRVVLEQQVDAAAADAAGPSRAASGPTPASPAATA